MYCRGGPPWPPGVAFRFLPPSVFAEIDFHADRAVGMSWYLEIEFHAGRPRRAAPTVRSSLTQGYAGAEAK